MIEESVFLWAIPRMVSKYDLKANNTLQTENSKKITMIATAVAIAAAVILPVLALLAAQNSAANSSPPDQRQTAIFQVIKDK